PQLGRVSLLVLLHLAHERLRTFLLQKVACGVLQQLLFFRQSQIHFFSAFLSTAVPDSRRPLPLSDECLARTPDVVRRTRDVSRLISGTIYCFPLLTSSPTIACSGGNPAYAPGSRWLASRTTSPSSCLSSWRAH